MNNKNAVSEANSLKAKAGIGLSKVIEEKLEELKSLDIIKSFKSEVNFSHPRFFYDKQYLANYLIETVDNKFIVVRSSTSFRSDRAKIGYYDLEGIIRYSKISNQIIASVYLVPDSEKDERDFLNTRYRISQKAYYSPATHLLLLSEFIEFLERYKINIEAKLEEAEIEKPKGKMSKEQGRLLSIRGNAFELEVVEILNNKEKLKLFQKNKLDADDLYYIILDKILKSCNIKQQEIIKVLATNTVPLLKNGGSPKTDVIVTLVLIDSEITHTISIKRSENNIVSCHDYPAKDFIRVLDCMETRLAYYLNLFQQNPSYTRFESNLEAGYSLVEFKKLLSEKAKTFSEWVLSGRHDVENLVVPELQVSNFILINKSQDIKLYSIDEFINLVNDKDKKQNFGVPFAWTYPSKSSGSRIQLKVRIQF